MKTRFLYVLQTYVLGLVVTHRCSPAQAAGIMSMGAKLQDSCLAGAELLMRAIDFADHMLKDDVAAWAVFQSAIPTHRCKVCGALWKEFTPAELPESDPHKAMGSWSCVSLSCGKCCDNVAMGEQIERL